MRRTPSTQADALLARARRFLSDHRTRAKRDGAAPNYTLADVRQLLAALSASKGGMGKPPPVLQKNC